MMDGNDCLSIPLCLWYLKLYAHCKTREEKSKVRKAEHLCTAFTQPALKESSYTRALSSVSLSFQKIIGSDVWLWHNTWTTANVVQQYIEYNVKAMRLSSVTLSYHAVCFLHYTDHWKVVKWKEILEGITQNRIEGVSWELDYVVAAAASNWSLHSRWRIV
jgi:hypothetical protein